ncbi:hypothetical protein PR048_006750 [Dryococelus australis]|uniref:Uncharacterized protein n=1 Tax=Dryococelus australis TaxID=614101 RepID=A0ABQ9IBU2_9NEOP|nr:hypothetical protein PR048_006750 [Dryococelus australis]
MADCSNVTLSARGMKRVNNGRKRKKNIGLWKYVKRKKLRDAGFKHKSTKGKVVPAKQPPTQVSEIMMYGLFRKQHKQGVVYVFRRRYEPARRKKLRDANARKQATFRCKVQSKEVCETTFLEIFSITQRQIQTIRRKLKYGITTPKDEDFPAESISKSCDQKVISTDFNLRFRSPISGVALSYTDPFTVFHQRQKKEIERKYLKLWLPMNGGVIAEGFVDPSKLTIQEMMTEDFKDIGCIELVLKKSPALRITGVLWIRLCSDDLRVMCVCVPQSQHDSSMGSKMVVSRDHAARTSQRRTGFDFRPDQTQDFIMWERSRRCRCTVNFLAEVSLSHSAATSPPSHFSPIGGVVSWRSLSDIFELKSCKERPLAVCRRADDSS